jgi:hypothetical protein
MDFAITNLFVVSHPIDGFYGMSLISIISPHDVYEVVRAERRASIELLPSLSSDIQVALLN